MPNVRPKDIPTTASYPAPDDWEILDGTVNGTRKLAASYRDTQIMTRAPGNFLQSDGATPNRGVVYTGGTRQNIAGVPVFELLIEGRMPASSPINTSWWQSAPLGSSFGSDQFNSYRIGIQGTGFVFICANGASFNDRRIYTDNTQFISRVPAGQSYRLSVTHIAGTAAPIVILNGTDISSSFVASFGAGGSGTAPGWQDPGLSSVSQVAAYLWPVAEAPVVTPVIGSLATAERAFWFTTGRFPAWVHAGGSAVGLLTGNDSTFTSGLGSWSNDGTTSDNTTAPGKAFVTLAASGFSAFSRANTLTAGVRYNFRLKARLSAGSVPSGGLVIGIGTNATTASFTPTSVEQVFTGTLVAGVATLRIGANSSNGSSYELDDIELWAAGALTLPGVQGIGTVRDLTTIGGNQGRLVGITPCLAVSVPMNSVERPAESYTAATSVQLLGGAITGGRKRRLVSVSGNSSASVNLSLGTSSGGTQLVNAQAVNGDFDISTFASRILAANSSLWITFSGNTTASIVIQITDL